MYIYIYIYIYIYMCVCVCVCMCFSVLFSCVSFSPSGFSTFAFGHVFLGSVRSSWVPELAQVGTRYMRDIQLAGSGFFQPPKQRNQ